jgi:hypothetical protein
VPIPAFGITQSAPAAPNPWTSEVAGFYYVDASSGASTDSGNTYGTPARPRKTIPQNLPAGSVVELHGSYDRLHTSPNHISASGTAAQPVYLRGASTATRPRITQEWELSGSYFIVENLLFADRDGSISGEPTILGNADHIVMRHNEITGNLVNGGLGLVNYSASTTVSNVVIYDNNIHHNGNAAATFDQDVHGIAVGGGVNNAWIVDNQMSYNSGDGIQINAGSAANQSSTHHLYVARNTAHHNKQSGFWVKQATDVIFSENFSYSHRPSGSSPGQGMGFQYATERVWFLYNHIHDCDMGIFIGSDNGLGNGVDSYFIGNLIHNIHTTSGSAPSTDTSAAFVLRGGTNRYVINNTVYDVDGGIYSSGAGSVNTVNNIVSSVTVAGGAQIWLDRGTTASASEMHHNLLDGVGKIRWGSSSDNTLAAFQSSFNKGQSSRLGLPLFVAPVTDNFRLLVGSPAIDGGTTHAVYSTFSSRYGVSIARDRDGNGRPAGAAWDMGAYEYGAGPVPTAPNAPGNVRIIK